MKHRKPGAQFFKPAKKTVTPPARQIVSEFSIERLSSEGRGIAFIAGKSVFMAGALPGERVRARIVSDGRDYAEAELLEIIEAAPARIAPRCVYFGECGGCQLQMLDIADQLAHKQQSLQHLLRRSVQQEIWSAAITASPWHYRHRVRLAVAEHEGRPVLGFKSAGSHRVVPISSCAILAEPLQPLLRVLPEWLEQLPQWRRIDELLLCIDSDDRVGLLWRVQRAFPRADAEQLTALCRDANILTGSEALLRYRVPSQDTAIAFAPDDFTQVNPAINDLLATRAVEWLEPTADDSVADFFCGLGNFTLPMARRAGRVDGYELSEGMVRRAGANATAAGFNNAHFHALDLFDALADFAQPFTKALLDPPRAGAKLLCEKLLTVKTLKRIVYVSCNPQTLARDLDILAAGGFVVAHAALVDMFAQTGHSEAIVCLQR